MTVYYFSFEGYYPVKAVGIVFAFTKIEALRKAKSLLKQEEPNLNVESVKIIGIINQKRKILSNGDY